MVNIVGNILTPVLSEQVTALKKTARIIDSVQLQLASGLRVNSALDNPQNFFAERALSNRAADLSRLLDGINLSIRTVQAADAGVSAVQKIINQADGVASEARAILAAGVSQTLEQQILEDEPVAYYKLNETAGNTAENLGTAGTTLNATYQNPNNFTFSEDETYITGDVSAFFDGSNNTRVRIPNNNLINTDPAGYPERTVEVVFRASSVDGRQVIFEEGGTGNAAAIYIDNGRIYFNARDAGDFGPFNISAEVEAGKTYHAAFTLDAPNATFTGYLNGEVVGTDVVTKPLNRHTARTAIGGLDGGSFFHDGAQGGNGLNFIGQISDVAIYNDVIDIEGIQNRFDSTLIKESIEFQAQVASVLQQLDPLVEDTSFRGINLLSKDDLVTFFNEKRTNSLVIEGVDFSLAGLGLVEIDFHNLDRLDDFFVDIRNARNEVRGFGFSLASDLSILQNRESFVRETVETLETGADDLIVADQNKLGANLLALQTRQSLQATTLSLASQSSSAVLRLF